MWRRKSSVEAFLCCFVNSIVITSAYTKHQNHQAIINHFVH